ncbi:cell division protein FtsL [Sulfurivermis fontis]|jgi:cell division protein FtsL|uniref:cell division protein FtsL n=1 Tax=Sulfurivermis fontis TaxID=1972068 RepID=UPI000FD7636C|nr:cell division protein FtsL [Sulfurivermis fontis]
MFLALLAGAVFATALGVVYTQHQARKSFVELQALQAIRDELNIEWGRLQLEQSTWATHGRIEMIARDKLEMMIPPPDAVVLVKP